MPHFSYPLLCCLPFHNLPVVTSASVKHWCANVSVTCGHGGFGLIQRTFVLELLRVNWQCDTPQPKTLFSEIPYCLSPFGVLKQDTGSWMVYAQWSFWGTTWFWWTARLPHGQASFYISLHRRKEEFKKHLSQGPYPWDTASWYNCLGGRDFNV